MFRWILGVWVALCLAQAAGAAAPLSAYGRLPMVEDVAMSASGRLLALVVTDGEDRFVAVQDVDSGKLILRSKASQSRLRDIRFVGETHLIIVTQVTASPEDVETRRREWWMGSVVDIATGRARALMSGAEGSMNVILGTPEIRMVGDTPLVLAHGIRFESGVGRVSLFELDVVRGRTRLVETGDPETQSFVVGPDGVPLAEERFDRKTRQWSLRVRVAGNWQDAAIETGILDRPSLLGLTSDGAALLYRLAGSDGAWKSVSLDGSRAVVEVQQKGLSARDVRTGRVKATYAFEGERRRYDFFDPADAAMWRTVERAFPDNLLTLLSSSQDRQRIVVEVDSPTEGLGYALVDRTTKRATWLGESYPDLGPADISERRPIRYNAADGLELPGYLTLPRGREAKNLPLIVFPHGGPAAMDGPGFDWWAQGMASRGYAVLQVNFRGSEGLGRAHLEAGYGEWGRKMQTDLSDGVRHLAAQGIIDPRRVCIVGASYGGYAALAGATLDPGVYRCSVSVAGISDLRRFVAWSRTQNGALAAVYLRRFLGAEANRDPALTEVSPVAHVDKVAAPILLIHGKEDTVVPLEQSRLMADALRRAGKPVELIEQRAGDHWLSRGATRLETLTATMAFVEKHNPPN